MFKKNRSTSKVTGPNLMGDFQCIQLSGYLFRPDEVETLLNIYEQVSSAPKILLDLSGAEWLTSIGVAAVARVVAMSLASQENQQVYIVVKSEFKERYFDERPWAEGRVFESVEDLPEYESTFGRLGFD